MPTVLIWYAPQVLNIKFELKDNCELRFCTTQHLNPFKIQKTDLLYLVGFLRAYLTQFMGVGFCTLWQHPSFKKCNNLVTNTHLKETKPYENIQPLFAISWRCIMKMVYKLFCWEGNCSLLLKFGWVWRGIQDLLEKERKSKKVWLKSINKSLRDKTSGHIFS